MRPFSITARHRQDVQTARAHDCDVGDSDLHLAQLPASLLGIVFSKAPSWFRSPRSIYFGSRALRTHASSTRFGATCYLDLINVYLNKPSISVSDL